MAATAGTGDPPCTPRRTTDWPDWCRACRGTLATEAMVRYVVKQHVYTTETGTAHPIKDEVLILAGTVVLDLCCRPGEMQTRRQGEGETRRPEPATARRPVVRVR